MAEQRSAGHSLHSRPTSRQVPSDFSDSLVHAANKTPWTSARCNRLLRPLSSKIALLRKEKQSELQQNKRTQRASGTLAHTVANSGSALSNGSKIEQHTKVGCSTATDEAGEWESSPRPRKIKRTYSSKTKISPSREDDNMDSVPKADRCRKSATIDLPPRFSLEASPPQILTLAKPCCSPVHRSRPDPCPPHELIKDLASNTWKLVDGICKGLVALLKATYARESHHRNGTRSLLSTCLSQIPQYITEEELLAKADDPDNDADVSTMIYDDLEELGSMPGGGWEPLRLLVRAHGIKMIADAIEEGLLGLRESRHLFHLCLDIFAYDEAQCLIVSMTTSLKHAKSGKNPPYELHVIITSLDSLASKFGRKGFLYRQTAAMLQSGKLTIGWISSKLMIAIWNEVVRSITQEDEDVRSAVSLLRTAVVASYRGTIATPYQDVHDVRLHLRTALHRPTLGSAENDQAIEDIIVTQPGAAAADALTRKCSDSEASSTLSNVLTVLSTVAHLQAQRPPQTLSELSQWTMTTLEILALEARQTIDLWSQGVTSNHSGKLSADSVHLPLLSAGLAELSSIASYSTIPRQDMPSLSALAELSTCYETIKDAGSFLCAVARCCGRARSEDAFNIVSKIVQDLTTIAKSMCSSRPMQKLCSDLALNAAFTYAEDTSRPTHLDWASQVELNLIGNGVGTPKPAAVRTPARGNKLGKSNFRWEEGICEWIARTPDLLLRKPTEVSSTAGNIENPPQPLDNGVKMLPPLSEMSPSRFNQKTAKKLARFKGGEAKALHVLIPVRNGKCGSECAANGLRFKNSQLWDKSLRQTLIRDVDEDKLQDPLNADLGIKRKRPSGKKQKLNPLDNHSLALCRPQPEDNGQDPEAAGIDELALSSKW